MKNFDIKSCAIGLIIGGLVMVSIPSFAANKSIQAFYNNIKLSINNKDIKFADGEEPFIVNGRTFLPAKYVAEGLGATIKWNETTNTVEVTSNSNTTTNSLKTTEETSGNTKGNVPEINGENSPTGLVQLRDGDNNFEVTTYNGYKAVKYKEYTYVLIPQLNLVYKINKNNGMKLYKRDNNKELILILETENAAYKYYVTYGGGFYINIDLVKDYLN